MKKQWNKLAILAIAAMFTFSSCDRNKEAEPQLDAENTQSLEDNSFSESEFDAITDIEQATSEDQFAPRPAGDKNGLENLLPQCAVITVEAWTPAGTNLAGKKITINFGTTGCTYQGRTYKGKIISYHNKKYSIPGAMVKTTFDGFYVKKANEPDTKYVQLLATKIVVNESASNSANPNIAVAPIKHRVKVFGADGPESSYAKLLFPNGKTIEWNTERLRTWAEGSSTPFILADDIFLVAGTHKGKNINNVTFQVQTVEGSPLQFKFVCWVLNIFRPTKGKLQISSSNTPTFVVDFGDGSCDNNFTVQQ